MQDWSEGWMLVPALAALVSAWYWTQKRPSLRLRRALRRADERARVFHRQLPG